MVNESYTPSDPEEKILDLMTEGRQKQEPWGYTTPAHIRTNLDIQEGNESFYLRQLSNAGWIKKEVRGFYKFVEDPRQDR